MQLTRVHLTTGDTNSMQEADSLGRNWYSSLLTAGHATRYAWGWQPGTQMIHLKQSLWDTTDTLEAVTLGHNWYTWSGHLGTQLIHLKRSPCDATDTLEAVTLEHNWYTWSGHLVTQLIHLKRSPCDATDTLEAVTLGHKWYNFLTVGRNLCFPISSLCVTCHSDIPIKRRTGVVSNKYNLRFFNIHYATCFDFIYRPSSYIIQIQAYAWRHLVKAETRCIMHIKSLQV